MLEGEQSIPVSLRFHVPQYKKSSKDSRELVYSDNNLQAKLLGVFDVFAQVGTTLLEQLQVFSLVDIGKGLSGSNSRSSSVHLQKRLWLDERSNLEETRQQVDMDIP